MDIFLKQLIRRLDSLEQRTEEHLLEASGIKTDLSWIKKMIWLILTIFLTDFAATIIKVLKGH